MKVGTIMEDSPIGFDKWLPAIWLIANCKNGISSHELSRALGVTQKTAWFILHRIRLAMQPGSFDKLGGGSRPTRRSSAARPVTCTKQTKRAEKIKGRGGADKTIVFGLRSRATARLVPKIVQSYLRARRSKAPRDSRTREPRRCPSTRMFNGGYTGLDGMGYTHEVVDHMQSTTSTGAPTPTD